MGRTPIKNPNMKNQVTENIVTTPGVESQRSAIVGGSGVTAGYNVADPIRL